MSAKIILTTCPDLPTAHLLAEGLVEQDLAACVNIIPAIVSLYKWEGKMEQSQETQLIIKSVERNFPLIESFITQNHPYDVPELLEIDVSKGSSSYLQWLETSSQQGSN